MQYDFADAQGSPLIHVLACWGLLCTPSISPPLTACPGGVSAGQGPSRLLPSIPLWPR